MAKKKKLDDLDAELAALEAELAALEGKPAPAKAAAPPAPKPAAATAPAPAASETAEKKRRLPGFGRKKEAAAPDVALEPVAPPPTPAPAAGPTPAAAPAPAAPPLPRGDLTHWRREGDAWVRVVPGFEGPVVRRVLDEQGATVREEPATRADLDEVRGVKAERGVGKLLGGAGGAMSKLKGFRLGKKGAGK